MQSLFLGDVEVSRPTTPCGTVIPHPPAFKVKLKEDTEILAGSTVRFAILVKGYPPPALTFLKNDQLLVTDDRVRITSHRPEACELVIEKACRDDSGNYAITAINYLGSAKTTGILRVTMDKILFPGNSSQKSSRCSTPRPGSPLYRWFKNGVEFEPDDRFECEYNEADATIALIFQHVTANDAGLYTCVAKTKRGQISCSAELKSEKTKAIFKRTLTDFEAREGDEQVDLVVKLDGSPKPKVRWFFEGKEIAEDDGFRFISSKEDNTHILRIQKVRSNLTGVFTCEAFNCEGKSETSGKFTVLSKPLFLEPLTDVEAASGTLVNLFVRISGSPAPDVTWLKNNKLIHQETDKIQILSDKDTHKLVVTDFSFEDMAEYTCEALNVLGRVASSCRVRLSEKPCFEMPLQDCSAQLDDENIQFTAKLAPLPKVDSVKWFVDDIEIVPIDKRYEISADREKRIYRLTVKRANEGTAGMYMCFVSNQWGESFSAAELRVASKPEFMQGLEDREAFSGESVAMDVVISGNPTPTIQWFKNSEEILPSSACKIEQESEFVHILTVERVTLEDMADYECVIRNAVGESRTKGRLVVTSAPGGNGFQDMGVGDFGVNVSPAPEKESDTDKRIRETAADVFNNNDNPGEVYQAKPAPRDSGSRRAALEIAGEDTSRFGTKDQNAAEEEPRKRPKTDGNSLSSDIDASQQAAEKLPIFAEHLRLDQNCQDFFKLKARTIGHRKSDVRWFQDGKELDVVQSKYCQNVDDDGSIQLVVRNPKAGDAGIYTLKIVNESHPAESSVRVDTQINRKQYSVVTLAVGGVAVVTGMYFMMRSVFPVPLSECEALSHAFSAGVHEFVYKCSAIAS